MQKEIKELMINELLLTMESTPNHRIKWWKNDEESILIPGVSQLEEDFCFNILKKPQEEIKIYLDCKTWRKIKINDEWIVR